MKFTYLLGPYIQLPYFVIPFDVLVKVCAVKFFVICMLGPFSVWKVSCLFLGDEVSLLEIRLGHEGLHTHLRSIPPCNLPNLPVDKVMSS